MIKLFSLSLSTSFIILLILFFRKIFLNKIPRKTFLILWYFAVYHLFLNFPNLSILKKFFAIDDPINSITYSIENYLPEYLNTTMLELIRYNELSYQTLFLIWISICLILIISIFMMHYSCLKIYKMALPLENDFFNNFKIEYSIHRSIKFKKSDQIQTPLTYGIWKPIILLSKNTDSLTELELKYILLHEYVHIKRFDIIFKIILILSLCIHWFNPLVWLMYIIANRDIEISCDELVLELDNQKNYSTYALTLLTMEEKKYRLSPLCATFSKNSLEERIESIMNMKENKKSILSNFIPFGILGAVLLAAPFVSFASETEMESNSNIFGGVDEISEVHSLKSTAIKVIDAQSEEAANYVTITINNDQLD